MVFRKCSAQCVLYFLRLLKYTVPTQLLQKGSARVHGEYFIAHTLIGLHIRHTCDTIPSPTKTARELDKRAKPLVTRGCNQKGMHTFWPCAAPFGSKTCNWSKEGVKEGVTPLLRWRASREKILLFIDRVASIISALRACGRSSEIPFVRRPLVTKGTEGAQARPARYLPEIPSPHCSPFAYYLYKLRAYSISHSRDHNGRPSASFFQAVRRCRTRCG